jgi:hypothetical protein
MIVNKGFIEIEIIQKYTEAYALLVKTVLNMDLRFLKSEELTFILTFLSGRNFILLRKFSKKSEKVCSQYRIFPFNLANGCCSTK